VDALMPLVDAGAVDQVAVIDHDSCDGTGDIARSRGAEVHLASALEPALGPVEGKGDVMWRALGVLSGDIVCFLDADSEDLGPHYPCGLAGPIACESGVAFSKARYRRPLRVGAATLLEGGGRVTELTARPLLRTFYPELAGFEQPLAGEIAATRDLLDRLPFAVGYSVDVALLIDAWAAVGEDALAEVDLGTRQNRHRPLSELSSMADAVLAAVLDRAARDGRGGLAERLAERPPAAAARSPD